MRPTARGRAAVTQRLRGPRRWVSLDRMTPEERLAARGITADRVASWAAASRARQGLPDLIEDPATLARIAALCVTRRPAPSDRRV